MLQALLSHRYGGRHIPCNVPKEDLQNIMEEIKSWETGKEDLALVEKWYKLDENAIPNEYILQPIIDHGKLEELYQEDYVVTSDTDDETIGISEAALRRNKKQKYKKLVAKGKKVWKDEESTLQNILRNAARKCLDKGILKEEQIRSFFQSSELF